MTLEDFFTLSELKDGLTDSSRVEELVSVMQKDKDSMVKNVGDTTRQWAAVASVIAATENRDCLDVFLQLGGLCYIGRWLKEVQNFGNELKDGVIRDSVIALLQALKNLKIDNKCSTSTGIFITVQNLIGHSSSQVEDIARTLLDCWKLDRNSKCTTPHADSVDIRHGNNDVAAKAVVGGETHPESSVTGFPSDNCVKKDICLSKSGEADGHISKLKDSRSNNTEDTLQKQVTEVSEMALDSSDSVENCSSVEKRVCPENNVENIAPEVAHCQYPRPCFATSQSTKKLDEQSKHENRGGLPVCANGQGNAGEAVLLNSVVPEEGPSSADPAKEGSVSTESGLQENAFVNEATRNSSDMEARTINLRTASSLHSEVLTVISEDHKSLHSSKEDDLLGKPKDLGTSFEVSVKAANDELDCLESELGVDSGPSSHFTGDITERGFGGTDVRTADIDLEYGLVDALEVARKVAEEAVREVDNGERSNSSSDTLSWKRTRSSTPDSISSRKERCSEAPEDEFSARNIDSGDATCKVNGQAMDGHNLGETALGSGLTQMTGAALENKAQETDPCEFDLNQEVCYDDKDNAMCSISTPKPVVSVSRQLMLGLPVAPLQFEGTLGWRGSAATSAFRPASPRKICSVVRGGTDDNSEKKPGCLSFDLNVAEETEEFISEVQYPMSSLNFQSTETSVDARSRRLEHLNLDLNSTNNDGEIITHLDESRLFPKNGHQCSSPASSLSSTRPSLRNIDLNDGPLVHADAIDQGPILTRNSWNMTGFGGPKSEEPVISILGTKVGVARKNLSTASSLQNGKPFEPPVELNSGITGGIMGFSPTITYAHPPAFEYNSLKAAPAMPGPTALYGPGGSIPCMLNSRGASHTPQIFGPVTPVQPAYFQPSFIMGMPGAPPRSSFDLNSGYALDGVGREPMGLRQLFFPGQSRAMEEHPRLNLQPPSSSGNLGKRKEPEGGREAYSFNYRQQHYPWR